MRSSSKAGQGLRSMLHEARDRQKFFSDVQYLRDMQHKGDVEYQACLRRQEYRRDSNEKKQDHFGVQETASERSLLSNKVSSKQSSDEEESPAEPRPSTRKCGAKCDSKLPAITQSPVKQKHKSTMTSRKPEHAVPSKPSPEAPKIVPRKGRPALGRLTGSPERHSPRSSEDRGRRQWQPPAKAAALWGPGPVVQQEDSMWAGKTKLNRTTQERRNFISSSERMGTTESPTEGAKCRDPNALPFKEPNPALAQTSRGTRSPQGLSASLGPAPTPAATVGGPWRTARGCQGEALCSTPSLSTKQENDVTGKESYTEEEIWLAAMRPPCSSNCKQSRVLGTPASQAKYNNFEGNADPCRGNSLRNKPNPGSLRRNGAVEPVTSQSSVRRRVLPAPRLPGGASSAESNSRDGTNEKRTFNSGTKSDSSPDNDVNAKSIPRGCSSKDGRPGAHDYERECQGYLHGSRNSPNYLLSDRPVSSRPPVNSSPDALGSLPHTAPSDHVPTGSSMSSALGPTLDSGFSACQPLPAIRSRNPLATSESHSDFPVNTEHASDVPGAEDTTPPSRIQGAPLYADLSQNPQGSWFRVASPLPSLPREDLQGRWHMLESLQENAPFAFFVVSESPNQNDDMNNVSVSGFTNEKKKADPEKLKKLQESLLEEDSEEEGDVCRICQIAGGSPANPLLEPCSCVGSLRLVHRECLEKWLKTKITSGADLSAVKTCEMCKRDLLVNLDDFNMTEFFHKHQQSQAQSELMDSGLYLMLLLHLYEQRFAELMRLDFMWVGRERLSRNDPQPRPEENESRLGGQSCLSEDSELGDGTESSVYPSRIV
ncbi:probable E3 ubiquitin-protein ligase MARCH10 isoform X2 [Octodon degus]|uniref:RING-type E3 ubiquitin transferase n=1 Tax=Octodon degus TaxID=10160 RepID=A0A6P6EC64_OCTDE|nr:probable E3 ubiquitin-protein ligase MARCH10 isoform X2 [Octodon degus]